MENELKKKWFNVFDTNDELFLYGAGDVAKLLLKQIKKNDLLHKISGILVTKNDKNLSFLEGIPVFEIETIANKNVAIMISVSNKFKNEIWQDLIRRGFVNIIDGFKYVHLYDLLPSNEDYVNSKNIDELKNNLYKIYGKEQLFGENKFYQSLPCLDIDGIRPTDIRIEIYGIKDIITNKKVLDIGCNCGFFDITISEYAKNITGLEYSKSLSRIGLETKRFLDKKNIEFIQGDFLEFTTKERFDVILFFAVHGWLDYTATEGVSRILEMLNKDGFIIFESQDWDKGDKLFLEYYDEFNQQGARVVRKGDICDDGITNRKWVIFQV